MLSIKDGQLRLCPPLVGVVTLVTLRVPWKFPGHFAPLLVCKCALIPAFFLPELYSLPTSSLQWSLPLLCPFPSVYPECLFYFCFAQRCLCPLYISSLYVISLGLRRIASLKFTQELISTYQGMYIVSIILGLGYLMYADFTVVAIIILLSCI